MKCPIDREYFQNVDECKLSISPNLIGKFYENLFKKDLEKVGV